LDPRQIFLYFLTMLEHLFLKNLVLYLAAKIDKDCQPAKNNKLIRDTLIA